MEKVITKMNIFAGRTQRKLEQE